MSIQPPIHKPIRPNDEPSIEQRAKMAQIVWLALTFSSLTFAFVSYQQNSAGLPTPFVGMETMAVAMTMAAIGSAVGAFFYRRYAFSEARLREIARGHKPLGAPDQDPTKPIKSVMQHWMTTTVVCLALHESISLFGLILSMALADWMAILPFVAATVILNFLVYPNFPAVARKAGLQPPPLP